MTPSTRVLTATAALCLAVTGAAGAADPGTRPHLAQARNPCGAKNPCAAKNPCGAKNPCAAAERVDPKLISRPKGGKLTTARADLIKEGERLWKDTKLSTNGVSCYTCHQGNAAFNPTFGKPYPHQVAMVKERAGLDQVDIDEMVQMCMIVPMAAKPLPWDSKALAALSAYSIQVQRTFKPGAAKPDAANPCAAKNPCAPKR